MQGDQDNVFSLFLICSDPYILVNCKIKKLKQLPSEMVSMFIDPTVLEFDNSDMITATKLTNCPIIFSLVTLEKVSVCFVLLKNKINYFLRDSDHVTVFKVQTSSRSCNVFICQWSSLKGSGRHLGFTTKL